MKRLLQLILTTSVFVIAACAQDVTPVMQVDNPPNTPAQQAKHYVILVSLDGFRYDYPTKYGAPHIQSMASAGASAPDGMLPSYPSLTFPNHLSLVTGLYPEHHGIVANSFYDPARDDTYVYTQPKSNGDGTWYSGTPLWSLSEQQGMRSACLFWPGSEAEIAGRRPSYYLKFDNKLDDKKRVEQVLAWLALPPEQRPHFITLYYSNVDHAGHEYGPDSDEVRAAVHHVDDMMGDLQAGIAASKLPVDLIVVADHGMVALKGDPIDLSTFADLSGVHTEGSLIYAKDDAQAEKIYEQFKAHPDPRFSVYRRADVPKDLHYSSNPREGDPVIVPNGPYSLRMKPLPAGLTMGGALRGGHGFDPKTMPEMKAIFYMQGPDIKPGVKLTTFQNVDVYSFIVGMLGFDAATADGSLQALTPALTHESSNMPAHAASHPVLLKSVDPIYSDQGRAARISGSVTVSLTVGTDGKPKNIRVVRGVGYGLDEAAVDAVRQYRFNPAMLDGLPVESKIGVRVTFRIFD